MNKIILTLGIFFSSLVSFAQSQKEEFLYKDSTGKVLTEAQVDEIAKVGMSMKKGEMENGKRVIFVIPTTKETLEREEKERQAKLMALINQPLADFSFTDIKGNKLSKTDLKGKVVVFNFWFVECGPCIREMPELNS